MKKLNILLLGFVIAVLSGCTYSFPEPEQPTSGTADFTKVVAIGNSLTAGYMDGALYTAGQEASFVNIIAQQMQDAGISGEFNQPDINADNGCFDLADCSAAGRLILVNPLNPAPANITPGDPFTDYTGGMTLNNFGVPGMRAVDIAVSGYGLANPYFGRFAQDPTTSSVQSDALAANGSFIIYWLGGNDALGYATRGATTNPEGDGSNPADMTSVAVFDAAYKAGVAALITDLDKKGVLINVPDVQVIPYFTTVPWNAVSFDESDPEDAATIAALNAGYQAYNDGLDGLVTNMVITQEEADARKISFANGDNAVVITDNTLTDLTDIDPALLSMRQATANDLLTLPAGAEIPNGIGVQSPLGEEFTLTLADQILIADRVADFNAIIKSVADASGGDLVLFDFNTLFKDFAQNGVVINGSGMDATIFPPNGAFSLDGVHPNQRGSAYVASELIKLINETFGSNIPNVNPNNWPGNAMPIPPQ